MEYFHFLFDQHEIVFADGLEAESLHTGAQAMKSLCPTRLRKSSRFSPNSPIRGPRRGLPPPG